MANNLILDRLLGVKKRFVEVGELLTSPDVMSDMKRYIKLNKEYKELKPVVEAYEKYKSAIDNLESTRAFLPPKRMKRCARWPRLKSMLLFSQS
jgi:peptide chain release factor 1